MKKNTFARILCFALVLVTLSAFALVLPVSAEGSDQTYTYSISGEMKNSPPAYKAPSGANYNFESMGLDVNFSNPSDLVVDDANNVYIVDSGNNRIVCLDPYLKVRYCLSEFINEQGQPDSFLAPEGMFVSSDRIWVCDTGNARIVVFDRQGNFLRQFWKPESELFDESAIYKPVAIAVDKYNRVYVVSSTTYEGIIMMTEEGEFFGFIGAQATTISAWEIMWRRFQTKAQKEASDSNISTEYSNLTITADGFIYATIAMTEDLETEVAAGISGNSLTGTYSPVKLLNSAGKEIMRRNGFWPPAGEVDFEDLDATKSIGVSRLIDVAVGPERTWTVIDEKRNRTFTYDYDGNLLFAFGDNSAMLGGIGNIEAVAYQGSNMLILDKGANYSVTVFERTPYGDMIIEALHAENVMDYDLAVECWKGVLQRNSNYDAAYVGIGKSLYRDGKYAESLQYFEAAYDTANWSLSWSAVRRAWLTQYLWVLVIVVIAVIFGWTKLMALTKRVNKAAAVDGKARKTFGQEISYGFYVIFHPFDGFYDLKHEHRGSVRASLVFIGMTVLTFFYQGIASGYVINPTGKTQSFLAQATSVLVPLALFVVSNWCLTTLFDGEGNFKDILTAVGYCLLPMTMLILPGTVISNFVTASEVGIINMLTSIAFIWTGILLFFGTMVTHDYSMFKNLITILGTIVGMVFIMFLVILFSTLLGKLVGLVTNIVTEIEFRV